MSGFKTEIDDYPSLADDFPVSNETMARHRIFRSSDLRTGIFAVGFAAVFMAASSFGFGVLRTNEIALLAALIFAGGKILQLEKRTVWLEEKAQFAEQILWRHHKVLHANLTKDATENGQEGS